MLGRLGFGRLGPAGIAFGLYRAWRRLSPQQKRQIQERTQALRTQIRSRTQRHSPIEHQSAGVAGHQEARP
jgi:hypothetical protein